MDYTLCYEVCVVHCWCSFFLDVKWRKQLQLDNDNLYLDIKGM
jgi:hypothetical protein